MYKNKSLLSAIIGIVIITGGLYTFFREWNNPEVRLDRVKVLKPYISSSIDLPSVQRRMEICRSIPIGSTQEISESRIFISLPEDIYPYGKREFYKNGVEVAYLRQGEDLRDSDEFYANACVTRYYEFIGSGTVDLHVPSSQQGIPDYVVHFKVKRIQP